MRIFTAGIITETNTFAPWPTGLAGFEEGGFFDGNACADQTGNELGVIARAFRDMAHADGHDFTEGLFTIAQPSGPTVQHIWEMLRDKVVDQLRRDGPFDIVLLFLHGAMVATDCVDCEADLVQRIRAQLPDAVIGVELDPHCHLSHTLVEQADVVILMKEYPHIDAFERAQELYALCTAAAARTIRPVAALFDCRMLGFYPTTSEPMAGVLRHMRAMETRPGILSVSFAHGFPWGDTPDTGSRTLVLADGDAALAQRAAEELGRLIYSLRHDLVWRMAGVEDALDQAAARFADAGAGAGPTPQRAPGPVVLADTADNPGGGAPGDNTALLGRMLARGVRNAAVGAFWDPMLARTCAEAGVGARFAMRLGGKSGPASGAPLDITGEVRAIRLDHDQTGLAGGRMTMGLSAWVSCDGIELLICSIRTQVFAPDAFTGIGITLDDKALVAVKSSHHFHAQFAPIASAVIPVATPGTLQMDFAAIDYRQRRHPDYFPRTPNPLGP